MFPKNMLQCNNDSESNTAQNAKLVQYSEIIEIRIETFVLTRQYCPPAFDCIAQAPKTKTQTHSNSPATKQKKKKTSIYKSKK